MAELPAGLRKQIGPFPVVGWLGIIAAGVVIGLVLRRSSLFKSKPEPPMELDADGVPISSSPAGWPAGVAAPSNAPASGGGGGGSTSTQEVPPPTNLDWSRRAIDWLISQGVPPSTADRAVRLYLEGGTLSIDEASAINLALRGLGSPPEYVPPMQTTVPKAVPSPPTPGAAPPASKKMLVRPSDGDIAQFVSDGNTKQWVPDGYTAKALVQSGNVAAAGTDGAGWPIPFPIPRSTIDALAPIGPPPNYGGQASPVKTVW